ncbi:hypothetical protein MKY66_05215 [Paenibacillus sp. FSL R5-0766]|uniref:hypothetical protein n=1 Tax=unclassified Paenibacillus TaxID=185978 RepID=UPI00096F9FE7|nr:hypothetical protein [Paenibacillus sp. FSL R5-0765]OMF63574.1 hypothetical protein BK141_17705 [Paenibacillus sp. FSL R5-0765]
MLRKTKIGIGALVGYGLAAISSPFLPDVITWAIPALATVVGGLIPSRSTPRKQVEGSSSAPVPITDIGNEPSRLNGGQAPSAVPSGAREVSPAQSHSSSTPAQRAGSEQQAKPSRTEPDPVFDPVIEYLEVLEDMIISEGQKNELDNEIVEKSLALFARLQRVIPSLQELNNGDINHTVRRLILKDLNGFINPFLRLSGEAKRNNRRMLLNGLRDVDSKISDIVSTIEHKDLMELQNKAELIHQRYNSSEL